MSWDEVAQEEPSRRRRSRERGPGRFYFTLDDLCEAFGVCRKTLARWRLKRRFDPHNFASVAALLRSKNPNKEEPK